MNEAGDRGPLTYAEAVHQLALLIPQGEVLSYGDVAELLGSGGARQVGKAMAMAPAGTPWWRVLKADGGIADPLMARAREHWIVEGLALPEKKVKMNQFRWNPTPKAWAQIDILRSLLGNPKMSELDDEL
ncbi:MGMT family protein [Glutamicibacter sp. JC586]|uniref:MGMT family protein n=1 Tax=Glutamicibacter sp. JC586 TaxID=2590552 RepID=UPI00135C2827|nr:MGMT family protein [Glutamicibacter sp. JC586]